MEIDGTCIGGTNTAMGKEIIDTKQKRRRRRRAELFNNRHIDYQYRRTLDSCTT